MKKLSILLLVSLSSNSIYAMEGDGKEPFIYPKDQEGRIFTRSYRPPVVQQYPDAVVVDLQAADSDDDAARQKPFEFSGDEEYPPGARGNSPQIPDYTVTLGQEFIIAKEEGDTTYRFDKHYSSTNLFMLVNEYYGNGPRTHYFVFKAICKGSGVLRMLWERSQPERIWKQSYHVVVE